jgi:hypothetical protein
MPTRMKRREIGISVEPGQQWSGFYSGGMSPQPRGPGAKRLPVLLPLCLPVSGTDLAGRAPLWWLMDAAVLIEVQFQPMGVAVLELERHAFR